MKTCITIFVLLFMMFGNANAREDRFNIRLVTITEAPVYANARTVVRRLTTGLLNAHYIRSAQIRGINLDQFTVNPSDYEWKVFLPSGRDKEPGLLIWLSSNSNGDIPPGLLAAAEKHGLAVLTALDSGEDEDLVQQRAPLALMGLNWFIRNHSLDKNRILVAGAGDSAIAAESLALGFADIFTGVIAVDGGMGPESQWITMPVAPLPELARKRLDLIFLGTPGNGEWNPQEVVDSFKAYCLAGATALQDIEAGTRALLFDIALTRIESSGAFQPDPDCLGKMEAALQRKATSVESSIQSGDWKNARKLLAEMDIRFGGLAEEQVLANAGKLQEHDEDFFEDIAEFIAPFERDTRIENVMPRASPIYGVD